MVESEEIPDEERFPHTLRQQVEEAVKLETIRYYDENAASFAESTVDVEFSSVQQEFEALLDPGAKVLDFGCGSGRDAKRFIQDGFDVVASDGSSEMCKIAEKLIGRPVRNELFNELADVDAYDGIWACSSILHLPKPELGQVLAKMRRALKPGGIILRRDYHPGEWIEVGGLRERVERITEIDVMSFAEKYEGFLSVEQVAREFFVNTGTISSWIRKGMIAPSASFEFGSRRIHLFSPENVQAICEDLGIPEHTDETIRDDFFDFLAERDYSLSYKMPFLLSFLDNMDPATGGARIDDVLEGYTSFYRDRLQRGLPIDRSACPYNAKTMDDHKFMKRSMLVNPFEKFERKRFMYYSKDLGQISINHALQARLTDGDLEAIRLQMHADLEDYYAKLDASANLHREHGPLDGKGAHRGRP